MITADAVKLRAAELGFDLCGIASAEAFPELSRLREWLNRGHAGEMAYMEKSADARADIRNLLPSAKSVIVTGTFYNYEGPEAQRRPEGQGSGPEGRPRTRDAGAPPAVVARYAQGDDYHVVLTERLERLAEWMRERAPGIETSIFADKHHVQERAYAARAGLGWVGKNTCVIDPGRGSWFLIAGLACSLDLEPDTPVADHCGGCTACLDACPTGALVEPWQLDARRCISYLTIELESAIPEAQRPWLGNHVFGCDICQAVCPWNLAPLPTGDAAWAPKQGRDRATLVDLWNRSDQDLRAFMDHSAMLHVTLARFRRNLAVAMGNTGDSDVIAALDRPGGGVRNAAHSADTPVVREHVAWARGRRAPGGDPV